MVPIHYASGIKPCNLWILIHDIHHVIILKTFKVNRGEETRVDSTNEPRRNIYNRSWREAIDVKGYRSHLGTLQNNDDPFFSPPPPFSIPPSF